MSNKGENSGFNVNYYLAFIANPKREGQAPYTVEVEDLIEHMKMTFHEGNILKSLFRSVNERELGAKKEGGDAVRDAEKIVHAGQRTLVWRSRDAEARRRRADDKELAERQRPQPGQMEATPKPMEFIDTTNSLVVAKLTQPEPDESLPKAPRSTVEAPPRPQNGPHVHPGIRVIDMAVKRGATLFQQGEAESLVQQGIPLEIAKEVVRIRYPEERTTEAGEVVFDMRNSGAENGKDKGSKDA